MRCLFFGSRNLTWKHLETMRALALYTSLSHIRDECGGVPPLSLDLMPLLLAGGDDEWSRLPESESLVLLHGDGPPGKNPGAIGADKLSEVACMERWPARRVLRRFPADPVGDESWGQAAARRNAEMVAAKPHRVMCVHTNLDASKGSAMTADMLKRAGIRFWLVTVAQAGAVISVEER